MYKQMLYNHSPNAHVMRLGPWACTYEREFVPGGGLREQSCELVLQMHKLMLQT